MARYHFQRISGYQGQLDVEMWRDGKSCGRICIKAGIVSHYAGGPLSQPDLDALNAWRKAEYDAACDKFGTDFMRETIGDFVPLKTTTKADA